MRVGHLDCASGAAGDMLLGALVDAGAPLSELQAAVDALHVERVRLEARPVRRAGMAALKVEVRFPPSDELRTYPDVRRIIDEADLPDPVRDHAAGAFRRLAEAEAAAHQVSVDDVHFHEVGALDALADVVGACAGVHALGLGALTCGPIATGTGTVSVRHGVLPLPVPAVVSLLTGFTLYGVDEPHELVTPTGAALVAELTEPVPSLPPMTLTGHGAGAGSRELSRANVLRLLVGERDDLHVREPRSSEATLIETTVDDLTPEFVPVVLDKLRQAGAHDAWAVPILMKKGRPGFSLVALTDPERADALSDVLLRESSTLGVRVHPVRKVALPREWIDVEVRGRTVSVKLGILAGEIVTVAPEFDDVRAAAEALGIPAREVHAQAQALARRTLAEAGRTLFTG